MKVNVSGLGAWGPGFCSIDEFRQVLHDAPAQPGEITPPKPDLIPARERRRSPLMVRLAVEVAAQACEMAELDPTGLRCVFSSGIGDADLTDYMCRVLAGPDKLLSPTRFHNSVHNAAVGYWSISTGCEQAASFVASLEASVSLALMESMVQVCSDEVPVLLVLSDLPVPGPMYSMHPIDLLFGAALVLTPCTAARAGGNRGGRQLSLALAGGESQWPEIAVPGLHSLYNSSPAARSLCLLEALSSTAPRQFRLPLSEALCAELSLEGATAL